MERACPSPQNFIMKLYITLRRFSPALVIFEHIRHYNWLPFHNAKYKHAYNTHTRT